MSRRTAPLVCLGSPGRWSPVRFGVVVEPGGIPVIDVADVYGFNYGGYYFRSGQILRKLVTPNPGSGPALWGDGEEFEAWNVCPFALKQYQPVVCHYVPAHPTVPSTRAGWPPLPGSISGWVARPWFEDELPYLRVTLADVEVEISPTPGVATQPDLEITSIDGWLSQYIGVKDGTSDVLEVQEPYGLPIVGDPDGEDDIYYVWQGRGYFSGNIDFGGDSCKLELWLAHRYFTEPQAFNFYLSDVTLNRTNGTLRCRLWTPSWPTGVVDTIRLTNLELRLFHGHTIEFRSRP